MAQVADAIVIGGGIAGASAAAELAVDRKVVLLEMEDRPGYHATGRSAAMFVPTYGPPVVQAITRASADFFRQPPREFTDVQILSPQGELILVGSDDSEEVEKAKALGLKEISPAEGKALVSLLRTEAIGALLFDEAAESIEVNALHQGFLRTFRRRGGELVCAAEVLELKTRSGAWIAATKRATYAAPIVVNAAGAWSDIVARRAGVAPKGLTAKRRSAALVSMPVDVSRWPLTFGPEESFYFAPMGGKLMISPADATPVEPHDVWADDLLLAEAIERFQSVVDHTVSHVDYTWAGLRTFAADGELIIGFDPVAPGFFWLSGQGGYGIQTSPAAARIAAALIDNRPIPPEIAAYGISVESVSPGRF